MKKNFILFVFGIASINLNAQTTVSGAVSGTWNIAGSPYYVLENCTVPINKTLAIDPGVKVILARNTSIDVYGKIIAIGTFDNNIEFRSPNDTMYWDHIYVQYSGNDTSRFVYSKFINATSAISLMIGNKSANTMITEIANCMFTYCKENCIFGESFGLSDWNASHNPKLNPIIKNCFFERSFNGVYFYIHGYSAMYQATSVGNTSPIIKNNIFKNLSGTALYLSAGTVPGNNSYPIFRNNTLVNCKKGIFAQQPYYAEIKNNIFVGNTHGVERTGTTTTQVVYNCFYQKDSSNFKGFSSSFGLVVMNNSNGDPCDIGFNIFLNPEFSDTTKYKLQNSSPGINAGDPNTEFDLDGTIADLGAYGGPFAGNWIVTRIYEIPEPSTDIFKLYQNYPNPFSFSTSINYDLKEPGEVEISVFDLQGIKIKTLYLGWKPSGEHTTIWNGQNDKNTSVESGIYFYLLKFKDSVITKKMIKFE